MAEGRSEPSTTEREIPQKEQARVRDIRNIVREHGVYFIDGIRPDILEVSLTHFFERELIGSLN